MPIYSPKHTFPQLIFWPQGVQGLRAVLYYIYTDLFIHITIYELFLMLCLPIFSWYFLYFRNWLPSFTLKISCNIDEGFSLCFQLLLGLDLVLYMFTLVFQLLILNVVPIVLTRPFIFHITWGKMVRNSRPCCRLKQWSPKTFLRSNDEVVDLYVRSHTNT